MFIAIAAILGLLVGLVVASAVYYYQKEIIRRLKIAHKNELEKETKIWYLDGWKDGESNTQDF